MTKSILLLFLIVSCGDPSLNRREVFVDKELNELDQRLNKIFYNLGGKKQFILPDSNDFQNIPQDENNPITKEKVELGKLLFHETAIALSSNLEENRQTYSCASCHSAAAGFTSGIRQGIGEGGVGKGIFRRANIRMNIDDVDVQPIKSPTALNVAYQENTLWNGQFGASGHNVGTEEFWDEGTPKELNFLGFSGVETQAIAGLGAHNIVKNDEALKESWIVNNETYVNMFKSSFYNTEINKENIGLAIAAYERTLLANEAPFQKYLKGDYSAITESQKRGAVVFFEKASCVRCHSGPSLSDGKFHALGMSDLDVNNDVIIKDINFIEKKGRAGFNLEEEDSFKFKTPQLYNLKDHNHWGHGSNFDSIRDIVVYKNFAQDFNIEENFLDLLFFPLFLNEEEINNLVDFLENSLYDNNLERYQPEKTPSGLPIINNETGIVR